MFAADARRIFLRFLVETREFHKLRTQRHQHGCFPASAVVANCAAKFLRLVGDEFGGETAGDADVAFAHEDGGGEIDEMAQGKMSDDDEDGAEAVAFDLVVTVEEQFVVELRLLFDGFAAHEAAAEIVARQLHCGLHFVAGVGICFDVHEFARFAPGQRGHDESARALGGAQGEFVCNEGVDSEWIVRSVPFEGAEGEPGERRFFAGGDDFAGE